MIIELYGDISDLEALEINIADNVVRAELSDLEVALQVKALRNMGQSVADIAAVYGYKIDRVYDLLTFADMRTELQDAVHRGQIGLYHSIVLNKFPRE